MLVMSTAALAEHRFVICRLVYALGRPAHTLLVGRHCHANAGVADQIPAHKIGIATVIRITERALNGVRAHHVKECRPVGQVGLGGVFLDRSEQRTVDFLVHLNQRLQREIAAELGKAHVGRTQRVLVDEPGVARGQADAPDIDGRVYLPITARVGEFTEVRITSSEEYDLLALPSGQGPAVRRTARQAQ